MRNIDFIDDRSKVRDDGYYIDNRIGISIRLKPEEILFLREKFRDESLAKNVYISREVFDAYNREMTSRYQDEIRRQREHISSLERERTERPVRESTPVREGKVADGRRVSGSYSSPVSKQVSKMTTRKVENNSHVVSSTTNRPYKVTRSNKYQGAHVKKRNNNAFVKRVAIAGFIVVVCISSFVGIKNVNDKENIPPVEVVYVDSGNQRGLPTEETTVPIYDNNMQSTMRTLINQYAKVYHVDGSVAYDTLYELTDGFSSDNFLYEMTCDQLSCKGMNISADSYEELVIYFMRIMSQDPERYGKEATHDNLDYSSGNNYSKLIAHYCKVMREDPCLIYAIMAAETSFSSPELLDKNNPCGLMIDGVHLWNFPTLEAGLIETIAQVKSYRYNSGAVTIEDIGRIHCPVGVGNDPHNLNANWIPNVTAKYKEAYENQLQLFGEKLTEHSMLDMSLYH